MTLRSNHPVDNRFTAPMIKRQLAVSALCWVGIAVLVPSAATGQSAVGQQLLEHIAISGEMRVRGEFDDRTSGLDPDAATLLRTRLGILAEPSRQTSVYLQISDSRIFGEEQNTLTDASADRLDLHQAYIDWTPKGNVTLRIGRQELAFADERLIGSVNWANVTRAFDGLRIMAKHSSWTLDGFATVLAEKDATLATGVDPRQNDGADTDRTFFGAWFTTGSFELFALGDRNASTVAFDNVDRYTLGALGNQTVGAWRLKGTVALQLGRQTPAVAPRQDISAYMLSGSLSYAVPAVSHPSVGVQVDYLSGDKSPLDGTHTAFNTLYATNHAFYGYMDLFLSPSNQTGFLGLLDTMLRTSARPKQWILRADAHRFQLARKAVTGERTIGVELDLTVSRMLPGGLALLAGYSVFNPSSAAEAVPVALGGDVLQWTYLQGTVRF